jgi:hypothetical protein
MPANFPRYSRSCPSPYLRSPRSSRWKIVCTAHLLLFDRPTVSLTAASLCLSLCLCVQELIDEYYAACQDGIDTNGNGEVEEWNVVSAPQVKMLAEQCGCAAAGRAQAAVLWLATAAVVQHAVLH